MRKGFYVYLTLILMFLYLPIFYLMVYSFNAGGNMIEFTGFSLDAYKELMANENLLIIVINTLLVGLISALISTVIGFFGALTLYNMKNKQHQVFLNLLNSLFLVSPDVIIGIALLSIFTMIGVKLGFLTVVLAHIAFSVPVVVILVYAKLTTFNKNIIMAAKDLGASNGQIIKKIIAPLATPGIIGAFLTAFTYSIDDFAVTFFVTGNGFSTLAIDIYSSARQGISLTINALSTIIFVITIIIAIGYGIYEMKKNKE